MDFQRIPAGKRNKALQQQLILLSPFAEPGHFLMWQGSRAQLWIWDQHALLERLPQANHLSIVPDSALSLATPASDGERYVQGLHGWEWQRWRAGQLLDSRWETPPSQHGAGLRTDTSQRSPIQTADRKLYEQLALASIAACLLGSLLLQAGAWLDLRQTEKNLHAQLLNLEETNQLQARARRSAQQSRELWLARQALLRNSQSQLISSLSQALPPSASIWQRYDYQPGRLQLFLKDPTPSPRDYVQRLGDTGLLSNVQVQPEPLNQMVLLKAATFPMEISQ